MTEYISMRKKLVAPEKKNTDEAVTSTGGIVNGEEAANTLGGWHGTAGTAVEEVLCTDWSQHDRRECAAILPAISLIHVGLRPCLSN